MVELTLGAGEEQQRFHSTGGEWSVGGVRESSAAVWSAAMVLLSGNDDGGEVAIVRFAPSFGVRIKKIVY